MTRAIEETGSGSDADALFDSFAQARRMDPRDPLSARAARGYRSIWRRWLLFLAQRQVRWQVANRADVRAFIGHGLSPRKHSVNAAVSDVSRHRYWRVLQRLYTHALFEGQISQSPFEGVGLGERPANVAQDGTVLPLPLWSALPRFFADPEQGHDVATRNTAMLWLLYRAGLSAQEVRELPLTALEYSSIEAGPRWPCAVLIEGHRAYQMRRVLLDAPTGQALAAWLALRQVNPAFRSLPWVFFSRHGEALSGPVLFRAASAAIARASASVGLHVDRRLGPQILRNSLMRNWLDAGEDALTVAKRMGLKNAKSLSRLASVVSPQVRLPRRSRPSHGSVARDELL